MPASVVILPCSRTGCCRNDIDLSRNLCNCSFVHDKLSVSLISHHPWGYQSYTIHVYLGYVKPLLAAYQLNNYCCMIIIIVKMQTIIPRTRFALLVLNSSLRKKCDSHPLQTAMLLHVKNIISNSFA